MNDSCVIGYVHGGTVRAEFCASLLAVCMEGKIPVGSVIAAGSGPNISTARNTVCRQFLDDPREPEWLFMCDTDMWFPADMVDRLIDAADPDERPILGALCYSQNNDDPEAGPYPTMYELTDKDGELVFVRYKQWPEGEVIRVTATGAAALLLHRGVLEKVERESGSPAAPWFQETAMGRHLMGEDLTFCLRAAAAGFPVHVATGVRVGHMKTSMLI